LVLTGNQPIISGAALPGAGALTFNSDAPSIQTPTVEPLVGNINVTGQSLSTNVAHAGTAIKNIGATTAVPSNYEQCDFSGFRVLPGSLKYTWNKHGVRRKSWDERHPETRPQTHGGDKQKGPQKPEQNDRFIGEDIDEITRDDL